MIQSPQSAQRVTLSIDGATVSLGSTVYVTAQANQFLTINTLEGLAEVTVSGQTQSASPGTAIQVPLDANLRASGPPAAVGFYSADTIRALPIAPLPNPIIAVPGLPSGTVATNWTWVADKGTGSCDNHDTAYNIPTTMIGDASSNYLWIIGMSVVLVKSAKGTYQGTVLLATDSSDVYYTFVFVLQFVDATHMTGQEITTLHDPGTGGCTLTQMLSITETNAPP